MLYRTLDGESPEIGRTDSPLWASYGSDRANRTGDFDHLPGEETLIDYRKNDDRRAVSAAVMFMARNRSSAPYELDTVVEFVGAVRVPRFSARSFIITKNTGTKIRT